MKLARNQFTPPAVKRPKDARRITLELMEAIERWAAKFGYSAPALAAAWGTAQQAGGVEFPLTGGTWAAWIEAHSPMGGRSGQPRIRIAWPADSKVAQTADMTTRADGRLESSYTASELHAALAIAGYDIPPEQVERFVDLASKRSPLTMAVALIVAFDQYHAEIGTAPWDLGPHRVALAEAAIEMGITFYWFPVSGGYEDGGPEKWREWAKR